MLTATGFSGSLGDVSICSVLASVFKFVPDTSILVVSVLEVCSVLSVSGNDVESLRGRPLLRFGERGGFPSFPSSLGEVGCGEGLAVWSGSVILGGVLGGLPLLRFKGVVREFIFESVELEGVSLHSVFLAWLPPLPLCCCSPSWAAMRDSVSTLRRTGRFLNTGMSGER